MSRLSLALILGLLAAPALAQERSSVVAGSSAESAALSAALVQDLKRGTVLVRSSDGEGSGFFVADELVMTNAHVLGERGVGAAVELVLDSGTREAATVRGWVAATDTDVDLALLLVPSATGRALTLSSRTDLFETQGVVAVGFPMGHVRALGGEMSDPPVSLRPGAITALYRADDGGLVLVEHNANMQTGSSGGPLVDARGEVIGVNVAILRADETTKLAIPSSTALLWLASLREGEQSPVAQAQAQASVSVTTPAAQPAQVIRHEIARPFELGLVEEVVVGPQGDSYVLLKNGAIGHLSEEGAWSDTESGTNNADIAVDDETGSMYVVESDTGRLLRYDGDQHWTSLSPSANAQVAASRGQVWALTRDGAVKRFKGGSWEDLHLTGTEEVLACTGLALLRRGERVWIHDGTELANDGEPVLTGVRQLACFQQRAYGLMTDGSITDLMNEKVVDSSTNNVAIYPTPTGLLALTRPGEIWFFDAASEGWYRLQSP